MKCKICGKDFSPKVLPLHKKRCKPQNKKLEEYTNNELREMLEKKGLPVYGNKKELIERLEVE